MATTRKRAKKNRRKTGGPKRKTGRMPAGLARYWREHGRAGGAKKKGKRRAGKSTKLATIKRAKGGAGHGALHARVAKLDTIRRASSRCSRTTRTASAAPSTPSTPSGA